MSHEVVTTFNPSNDALLYPFDPRSFSARCDVRDEKTKSSKLFRRTYWI